MTLDMHTRSGSLSPELSSHRSALYNNMGTLAANQDQLEKARELYTAARDAFSARVDLHSVYIRTVEGNLAELEIWLGKPEEALARLEKILLDIEREAPAGADAARVHTLLAQTLLALGRIPAALDHAERAVKIIDAPTDGQVEEPQAAVGRATLANCLAAAHGDPKRVKMLRMLAEPALEADSHEAVARRALAAVRRLQTR